MSNSGEIGVAAVVADVAQNGSAAELVQDWKPTIAAPCGCHPEAGFVCDSCAAMAEKNVAELAEYVNDFITKRFPNGLEGDIRQIISECVLDAFHDGARWAEAQPPGDKSLIIGVDHAAPGHDKSVSRIIIAQR